MKINKTLSKLAFQIIPVMIGVYLGFLVSDWSANKQQNAKKKILVQNIIAEVRNNQANINSVVTYHEMLRDSSGYYSALNTSKIPTFFKGVNTSNLDNSAF